MPKKRKHPQSGDEKKSAGADIEREIKEAVERIPQMIQNAMRDQSGREKEERGQRLAPTHGRRKRIYLLWASVIMVSLLIFGMWVWNLRSVFSDVSEGRAVNETPFSNIEENFRQAIDLVDPEEIPQPKQEDPKTAEDSNAIEKITKILQSLTATSTATSTTVSD